MADINRFREMLNELPLSPEEKAYFLTQAQQNDGLLPEKVKAEFVERVKGIVDDVEELSAQLEEDFNDAVADSQKRGLDALQAEYDKAIKEAGDDKDQIKKIDEEFAPRFKEFE